MNTAATHPIGDLTVEPLRSRRNHWNNQVRRHALMKGDAPALRFGGVETSWRRLDERTHAFAAALQATAWNRRWRDAASVRLAIASERARLAMYTGLAAVGSSTGTRPSVTSAPCACCSASRPSADIKRASTLSGLKVISVLSLMVHSLCVDSD